jgi:hypothetical protein
MLLTRNRNLVMEERNSQWLAYRTSTLIIVAVRKEALGPPYGSIGKHLHRYEVCGRSNDVKARILGWEVCFAPPDPVS